MNCPYCVHFSHIPGYIPEISLFVFRQKIPFQQKSFLIVQILQNPADTLLCTLKILLFHIRKRKADNRVRPLKLSVLLIFPDRKPLKQISPPRIVHRKELFRHTHIQRLSEPSRPGNQGHAVSSAPPFFYKIRLINVKPVVLPYLFKILVPDCHSSCHRITSSHFHRPYLPFLQAKASKRPFFHYNQSVLTFP